MIKISTDAENPQSYTFLRKTGADTYLIMLNFSPKAAISTPGIDMSNAHVLLDNYGDRSHMAPQTVFRLRYIETLETPITCSTLRTADSRRHYLLFLH